MFLDLKEEIEEMFKELSTIDRRELVSNQYRIFSRGEEIDATRCREYRKTHGTFINYARRKRRKEDPEYRQRVNANNYERNKKYRAKFTIEELRAKAREYQERLKAKRKAAGIPDPQLVRYHSDPAFRERRREYEARRRAKRKAAGIPDPQVVKYHSDPAFRERKKQQARESSRRRHAAKKEVALAQSNP